MKTKYLAAALMLLLVPKMWGDAEATTAQLQLSFLKGISSGAFKAENGLPRFFHSKQEQEAADLFKSIAEKYLSSCGIEKSRHREAQTIELLVILLREPLPKESRLDTAAYLAGQYSRYRWGKGMRFSGIRFLGDAITNVYGFKGNLTAEWVRGYPGSTTYEFDDEADYSTFDEFMTKIRNVVLGELEVRTLQGIDNPWPELVVPYTSNNKRSS